MPQFRWIAAALSLALSLGAAPRPASADDPCLGFRWDVSRERAIFASPAKVVLSAAQNGAAPPKVEPDRLYEVRLAPAAGVVFPVTPGKITLSRDTYAGVLALTVPAAGSYRIAVDGSLWVDVAARGKLVPAADYEGVYGCSAPRKIVKFALDGRRRWILQLSGSSQADVRLTITRSPEP